MGLPIFAVELARDRLSPPAFTAATIQGQVFDPAGARARPATSTASSPPTSWRPRPERRPGRLAGLRRGAVSHTKVAGPPGHDRPHPRPPSTRTWRRRGCPTRAETALHARPPSRRAPWSVSVVTHRTTAELDAGLDEIRRSPKDEGMLELIVCRPEQRRARGGRPRPRSTPSRAWSATTGGPGQPPHRGRRGGARAPGHADERAGRRAGRRRPEPPLAGGRPALRGPRPQRGEPARRHPPAGGHRPCSRSARSPTPAAPSSSSGSGPTPAAGSTSATAAR